MAADFTPVRLLQITDTHLFADPQNTLYGVNTRATFQRVLDAAYRQPKPGLVLATGDLVHDASPAGYRTLVAMLQRLGAPMAVIAGNHDVLDTLQAVMRHDMLVGGTYTLDTWRIVLLNTLARGKAGGHLDEAELKFLKTALAGAPQFHVLVALHHHPVPIGSAWLDRIALDNADEFFDLVDHGKNVRGILWGHVHQAFDAERHGARLMATPSTCVQFLPGSADFSLDTRPPGMRWLTLYPDGHIETQVEWATNS